MRRWDIPLEESICSGTLGCQGCGAALAMRLALKGVGPETVVALPACCWSIIDGAWPGHALGVPLVHTAFETAAIAAVGLKAGLVATGHEETTVMAWAGDGGTYDIGLQALSGAAERNDDILYAVYDNEAYMNTGIQRSGATPRGAWTTTTPSEHPEQRPKKNIMAIMAAHCIPYAATASVAFPGDLVAKFRKAKDITGTRFIHIYSPCPPGWKSSNELSIEIARLAVLSKVFPLYEVYDGERHVLSFDPGEQAVELEEYLKPQRRFAPILRDEALLAGTKEETARKWEQLLARCEQPEAA